MMNRISFDRAADIYDQTRGHSHDVSHKIARMARALMPSDPTVLEIGIGTGRIARPLLEEGVRVYGIDISTRMMSHITQGLRAKTQKPRLTQADALQLPFCSAAFDAILAVHVFHLFSPWQQAMDEALRVRRDAGVLLTGYDNYPDDSPSLRLRTHWRQILQDRDQDRAYPGTADFGDLQTALEKSGAKMDEYEAASWEKPYSPARHIADLEQGVYSSVWLLDPGELPICIAELSAWAAQEFGDLERQFQVPVKFIWQRFRW